MALDKNSMDPAKRYRTSTRWLLFFFGLWVMTIGIAVMIHADLGTTPISTVPAAIAAATPFSFGVITIPMSMLFVFAQMLILRREFARFQLWQLLIAVVFGLLCDLSLVMTAFVQPGNYILQWAAVVVGTVLVSLGVFLQILPRILYSPAEGIVVVIALATGWRFGTVKQCFDWLLVVVAVGISLIFVGELAGVREGTVFAAVAVGGLAKLYQRMYDQALRSRRHP